MATEGIADATRLYLESREYNRMNRNGLAISIAAAVLSTAFAAQDAQAVHLNPNGLGQVLVYSYYTRNAAMTRWCGSLFVHG